MKNISLIILVLIFCQITASSQPCLPDGIWFTSQADIDNFQTNYPNCTEIEGDVIINGDDITNLFGLSVLTSFGEGLTIRGNPSLTSLVGFDNVTSIGGNLHILDNPSLTSLVSLVNVTSIGGDLWIENNDALPSLSGLDNVTSIGKRLIIVDNAALTSLTSLDNVTSIDDQLRINNNDALTSLTGLDNVTSIGEELWVVENDVLISLSGLDNIDAGSIHYLYIHDNQLLSTCEVQSICDYLAATGWITEIHDNASGCNSQTEVETACTSSVDDINFNDYISIYPNPANDVLTISCKNGVTIEEVVIYNITGQKVLEGELLNNTIDVSNLQQGMYIVELVSKDWKVRKKLIVE